MGQGLLLLDGLIGSFDFGEVGVLGSLGSPEGQGVGDVGSEIAEGLVNVGRVVVGLGRVDFGDLDEVGMGISESVAASFEGLVFCESQHNPSISPSHPSTSFYRLRLAGPTLWQFSHCILLGPPDALLDALLQLAEPLCELARGSTEIDALDAVCEVARDCCQVGAEVPVSPFNN